MRIERLKIRGFMAKLPPDLTSVRSVEIDGLFLFSTTPDGRYSHKAYRYFAIKGDKIHFNGVIYHRNKIMGWVQVVREWLFPKVCIIKYESMAIE